MAARPRGGFSVSGPATDVDGYPSGGAALSAAITFATRSNADPDLNFHVRDAAGEPFGRVERTDRGILIYRLKEERR